MVEGKHRHVLEIARAIRFHAGVPIHYWGECVLTAVHIINKLPTKIIRNKSPYEILYSKKPDYNHLKSLVVWHIFLTTRDKASLMQREN